MPQIVEPETRQARFLRQCPPSCPPAFHVPRRVKAGDVVVRSLFAAECELGNEGRKDVMRRFDRAEGLCSAAQPCQSRERHVRERNHSFASSRLGRANCQSAGEQVHVGPLQAFQLAAPCGGVQAENRSEVSRFPLRPHHSRFEKPLLFFLSYCPPDGARLFQRPYIVSNTRPELRSLQDAAQDAQLRVERGGADSLFRPPSPVVRDSLRSDGFERFLFEVGPQLHQELSFFRLAGGANSNLRALMYSSAACPNGSRARAVELCVSFPSEASAMSCFSLAWLLSSPSFRGTAGIVAR